MNSFSNSAFARFFTEFPKLLLAQLINAVAFAVFTALFVLLQKPFFRMLYLFLLSFAVFCGTCYDGAKNRN